MYEPPISHNTDFLDMTCKNAAEDFEKAFGHPPTDREKWIIRKIAITFVNTIGLNRKMTEAAHIFGGGR